MVVKKAYMRQQLQKDGTLREDSPLFYIGKTEDGRIEVTWPGLPTVTLTWAEFCEFLGVPTHELRLSYIMPQKPHQ